MKELKIVDQMQLYNELQILRDLVAKAKSENYLLQQEVGSGDISDKYMLTEEGHDVVDWFIFFPELDKSKLKPRLELLLASLIIFALVSIAVVIYLIFVALGFSLDGIQLLSLAHYFLQLISLAF
jgi:hypothetical protein